MRPGGIHAAFQVAWALAMAMATAAVVAELVRDPTPPRAVAIIEVTGVWALVAALAWLLRVTALTTSGSWGATTRRRLREAGRSEREVR